MSQPEDLTIRRYLEDGAALLSYVSDCPRLEAESLLAYLMKKPRSHLLAWPEKELDFPVAKGFEVLLRRRFSGEPVAYITGVREFWSMPLRVNRNVLIPRPETELLVEKVLEYLPERKGASILDLGTGSGNIALALARERPDARITAVEISKPALKVARLNAKMLHIDTVDFREGFWFEPVSGMRFDVIVSNPPYVEEGDEHLIEGDVRFEPENALLGGTDGLSSFRSIIDQAFTFLEPDGWLMFEHGYDQALRVHRLLRAMRYFNIHTFRDDGGRDRVTIAQGTE